MSRDFIQSLPRDSQIKFALRVLIELTVASRYHYDDPPTEAVMYLKKYNEEIHRVSGFLARNFDTDGKAIEDHSDFLFAVLDTLPKPAQDRLLKLFGCPA